MKVFPERKSLLYKNIGDVYGFKGDLDSAVISYSISIALDSLNIDAYVKRGQLSSKRNQLDAAIHDFKIAADHNPDYYYFLCRLQIRRRDLKDAKASLDSFLKYKPERRFDSVSKLRLDSIKREIGIHTHQ